VGQGKINITTESFNAIAVDLEGRKLNKGIRSSGVRTDNHNLRK